MPRSLHRTALTYSLPIMCLAILLGPAGSIMQGIYTREFGLRLVDIAGFIVICRFFDALTDPAIGFLSDRTRSERYGRKPWILIGAGVSIIAAYFLYNPPNDVTPLYFFIFFLFSYLGWTIIEIPHLAWGAELANDYDERSTIYGYRTAFVFVGALVFLSLPILIAAYKAWLQGQPWEGISLEYTGETLSVAFFVLLLTFPVTLYLSLRHTPIGERPPARSQGSVFALLKSLRWNKPFRIFLIVIILFFIGNGMQVALAYLHLASYLGLATQAAIIYTVCFPLNIICIPIWVILAKKIGKHRAYALGVFLSALGFIALGLAEPGENAFIQYFLIFAFLQLVQASWQALPLAILADVSDYGTWRSGMDQTGTYFSFYTLMYKAIGGLGGALGFALAAWYGFDPAVDTHDATAAMGVKLGMAYIPALLSIIGAVLLIYYPLTKSRHETVLKAIKRRTRREASTTGNAEAQPG